MLDSKSYIHAQGPYGPICAIVDAHLASGTPCKIDNSKRRKCGDTSRMDVREGYVNDTRCDTSHTPCDKARVFADIEKVAKHFDKGYKIYVKTNTQERHTLIGYVLCVGNTRLAIDVFGKKHSIAQAQRLREKHVRECFGIPSNLLVKQTCIQFYAQAKSRREKKAPAIPNAPLARRPTVG